MNLSDVIKMPLFERTFLNCLFSGISLAMLGVAMINSNLTPFRLTLMHLALLGAVVAIVFGMPPLAGALLGAAFAAFLLKIACEKTKGDIGIIRSMLVAGSLGVIFLLFDRFKISANAALALFRGNLSANGQFEVWTNGLLMLVVILVYAFFYREIQMTLYNSKLAHSIGIPVRKLHNVLLLLTGVAIATSFQTVGALLVDTTLLLPAFGALAISRSLKQALVCSAILGAISQVGGLSAAVAFQLPCGPSIALSAVVVLWIALIIAYLVRHTGGTSENVFKANNPKL